ncbi:MAG: glutaredoxin family protein [Acidobacteria bacterium]|nr:glutaredoxin family protein [Acidobacteriota bacterium]
MKPKVTFYTRRDCGLCEEAKRVVESVRRQSDFELEEIDIDGDPELSALYGWEVPVIAINGRKAFKYRVEPRELRRKLEARW